MYDYGFPVCLTLFISVFLWTDNQIAAILPRAMDAAGSLHPCLTLLLAAAVVTGVLCCSTN